MADKSRPFFVCCPIRFFASRVPCEKNPVLLWGDRRASAEGTDAFQVCRRLFQIWNFLFKVRTTLIPVAMPQCLSEGEENRASQRLLRSVTGLARYPREIPPSGMLLVKRRAHHSVFSFRPSGFSPGTATGTSFQERWYEEREKCAPYGIGWPDSGKIKDQS